MMFGIQKWSIFLLNWSIFISKFGKLSHENPMIVLLTISYLKKCIFLDKTKGLIPRLDFLVVKINFTYLSTIIVFKRIHLDLKILSLNLENSALKTKLPFFLIKMMIFFSKFLEIRVTIFQSNFYRGFGAFKFGFWALQSYKVSFLYIKTYNKFGYHL